jgi:hypothetical protein
MVKMQLNEISALSQVYPCALVFHGIHPTTPPSIVDITYVTADAFAITSSSTIGNECIQQI